MRVKTRIWIAATLALAALVVGACGLFDPRDSEPPASGSSCRALTDSTQVMLSIQEYYARSTSATCYNALIDTGFVFQPDPQDVAQYPPPPLNPFAAWDDSVEITDNSSIASAQTYISVVFLRDYQPTITSGDGRTQQHFKEYLIRFIAKGSSNTVSYSGFANITIHQGADGQWKVTVWADHRDSASGNSTWGILRAANRQPPF